MSKEGILTIFIASKDRAQRNHPSTFDILYSAVLRFAVAAGGVSYEVQGCIFGVWHL